MAQITQVGREHEIFSAGLWALRTAPWWKPARHLTYLCELITMVRAGEIKRLIVELPVRHGKSWTISHLAPAWWLSHWPTDRIMLASYEADFAKSWGRKARDLVLEAGDIKLKSDKKSAEWWETAAGGAMYTAGVGGPFTGKGFNLGIIDDPIKNAKEAESQSLRDSQWDWYISTFMSRQEPDGAVIIAMARWHEDDLVGRIKKEMAEGGEHWEVYTLPAIAGENDPMGRAPGEALWPERYSVETLEKFRKAAGQTGWFDALWQQVPMFRSEDTALFPAHVIDDCAKDRDVFADIFPHGPVQGRVLQGGHDWGQTSDFTAAAVSDVTIPVYTLCDLMAMRRDSYPNMVRAVAEFYMRWGVRLCYGDATFGQEGYNAMLREYFEKQGYECQVVDVHLNRPANNKALTFEGLSKLMQYGIYWFPDEYTDLKTEMRFFQKIKRATGNYDYNARDGYHDDRLGAVAFSVKNVEYQPAGVESRYLPPVKEANDFVLTNFKAIMDRVNGRGTTRGSRLVMPG